MNLELVFMVEECLKPVHARIDQLELLVDAIELDHRDDTSLLTRKNLAQRLGCSERFIQNHQQFKDVEHRVGNRVFYDWQEVRTIIKSYNKSGE